MPALKLRHLLVAATLPLGACVDNTLYPAELPTYQPQATAPACVPNLDGRIDAAELKPAIGVPARFRVTAPGSETPVDVAGQLSTAGQRQWDWSGSYPGEALAEFTAAPLAGQWYTGEFATGEFVVAFDAAHTIDAIYRRDDAGLWLLGLASHEPAPAVGKTLLPYVEPVLALKFPLQVGQGWQSVGKTKPGKGVFRGLPFASVDTYTVAVDAAGRLELPDVAVTQALRVRTTVQVAPLVGLPTTQRQVSFVTECLGEVARAVSVAGETAADFGKASEVRRLGL
jgi:hypothetical protein